VNELLDIHICPAVAFHCLRVLCVHPETLHLPVLSIFLFASLVTPPLSSTHRLVIACSVIVFHPQRLQSQTVPAYHIGCARPQSTPSLLPGPIPCAALVRPRVHERAVEVELAGVRDKQSEVSGTVWSEREKVEGGR
jgi:hypothetical protein